MNDIIEESADSTGNNMSTLKPTKTWSDEELLNLPFFGDLIDEVMTDVWGSLSGLKTSYGKDEDKLFCLEQLTDAIESAFERASQFHWDHETENFNNEFREGLEEDEEWIRVED